MMFKKLVTYLSLVAVSFTLIHAVALADELKEDFITSVDLLLNEAEATSFNPTNQEQLTVKVTANNADAGFIGAFTHATTTVSIVPAGGTTAVKTFSKTATDYQGNILTLTWDGKNGENPATIVADGSYDVKVHIESGAAPGTWYDDETKSVTVTGGTPTISIVNLTANPLSFDAIAGETTDISFELSAAGYVTVAILDGAGAVQATLVDNVSAEKGVFDKAYAAAMTWNGKTGTPATALTDGTYTVSIKVYAAQGDKAAGKDPISTSTKDIIISSIIKNITFKVGSNAVTTFDPSVDGQDLTIGAEFTKTGYTADIYIRNSAGKIIKDLTPTLNTIPTGKMMEVTWNGTSSYLTGANKMVVPGDYKVVVEVEDGSTTLTKKEKTIKIAYPKGPEILYLNVSNTVLNQNNKNLEITFDIDAGAYLTLEIKNANGSVVKTFEDFDGESDSKYSKDNDSYFDPVWDGKGDDGTYVSSGVYTITLVARNDDGVSEPKTKDISVSGLSTNTKESNDYIDDISFSPSSNFEPEEDDELEIEFDVKKDLKSLIVYALCSGDLIEIEDLGKTDKENNVQVYWDGTYVDDDEYVAQQTCTIQFHGTPDDDGAFFDDIEKDIYVKYEAPKIDELEVTKDEIDPEIGEVTHLLFKIDRDADVDIEILESGDVDETLEEEMGVEKDQWYSYEINLDDYDEDDDVEIRVTAANTVNSDVKDSEEIDVKIKEDEVSSSKSNVTNDMMTPVITDGAGEMTLSYYLDEDADVEINIFKGTSSSGTVVKQLIDVQDQEAGEHTLYWDGLNKSGNKLAADYYSYKITSKKSSTETETGVFVVAKASSIDSGSNSSDSGNTGSGVSQGVKIDGQTPTLFSTPATSSANTCAGFSDVAANSVYCNAVTWAKDNGVFQGYADGTFKPNQAINRVEMLKVVLESLNMAISPDNATNYGFSDILIGAWYMKYIATANPLGIFQGDAGLGTARPGDTVNRAEALKMTFEAMRIAKGHVANTCASSYTDVSANDWFYNYACEAKAYSLFTEFGVTAALIPGKLSSRGEVAQMLYQLAQAGLF